MLHLAHLPSGLLAERPSNSTCPHVGIARCAAVPGSRRSLPLCTRDVRVYARKAVARTRTVFPDDEEGVDQSVGM